MAKTIKSKVEYQVTELTNNLNHAATATSDQKRDFYTTRAMYNAKRLTSILNKAKVGAMALILSMSIVACGGNATTEATANDSTVVKADTTAQSVDTTATVDTSVTK